MPTPSPPEPTTHPTSKTRHSALLITLAAGFICYGLFFNRAIWMSVVGYSIAPAERVVQAEVPYRDFLFNYTPGILWLNALLMKLFGVSLMPIRIALFAFKLGTLTVLHLVGRRLMGPWLALIPVTLTLDSAGRGTPKRTFHFQVANDQMFTPLMAAASITSTLGAYERQYGVATFHVTGTAKLVDHDAITFDNIFSGTDPSVNAATYVAAPIAALLGNDYEKVDIDSLDLTISSAEEPKTAMIERVWLDDQRPRAGRTVPLKVLLRTYRGDDEIRTIPIEIPANTSGTLSLLVADGGRLGQIEQRETRSSQPRSVDQIVRTLNRSRRGNTIYVKLLGSDPGAVVKGEPLTALPPSVLGVLESDRSNGSFNPLTNATLGEWHLATDHAVSGSKTLSITVSSD